MTPEEFAKRMEEIAGPLKTVTSKTMPPYQVRDPADIELAHSNADDLMVEVLKSLGFRRGTEIFLEMARWYA